jgi:hypothetical protein
VSIAALLGGATSAHAITFSNGAPIAMVDAAPASPYPSGVGVSGVIGTVTKVTVTLHGFHHTCAHDVDALLAGPHGQETLLMSDAGDCDVGTAQPAPVELAFDDTASAGVPCLDGPAQLLQSGTYLTTNDATAPNDCTSDGTGPDSFPAPAPAGPYPLGLAGSNGIDPNGTWNLYVVDDSASDTGAIDGGWSLDFTVAAGTLGSDPQVKGTPDVGRRLTAVSGTLGNGAVPAYQWNRCDARGLNCKPIAGATRDTYKLARADRAGTLTLTEIAVTTGGASAPRGSSRTAVVGPALVSFAGTKRTQNAVKRHGLRLAVRSNIAGTLSASAKVGRAKFKPLRRKLGAGKRVRLTLRLTPAVRAAIAAKSKPRARLTLVVKDAGGARSTTHVTIKLKR